jgi:hypothetical protein
MLGQPFIIIAVYCGFIAAQTTYNVYQVCFKGTGLAPGHQIPCSEDGKSGGLPCSGVGKCICHTTTGK